MPDYEYEKYYTDKGYAVVCGTDEAGRGPLAGPVVAGACILPQGLVIDGLDDSKKITEKKREKLYDVITENAISWAVGIATPAEIDEINILNASLLAMRRAIDGLAVKPDFALVDGNVEKDFTLPVKAVVGGDGKSMSIAAASILAKVTRDRMCLELDEKYPQYNFKKHKGYPTKDHKLAVYEYGPCPEHRVSFLSFLEREKDKLAQELAKRNADGN